MTKAERIIEALTPHLDAAKLAEVQSAIRHIPFEDAERKKEKLDYIAARLRRGNYNARGVLSNESQKVWNITRRAAGNDRTMLSALAERLVEIDMEAGR